jgi:type VI secretion system secreted protein Hcp
MAIVHKTRWILCGVMMICLLIGAWAINAGPLDPSAPPASTMKSMQELYDLTNFMKGAALPAPLVGRLMDLFLWVDGIPGESTSDKHKDWIEAVAFHWGISRPGQSFPVQGQQAALAAEHADLTIVKAIDKSSPKLFLACCTGQPIEHVKFHIFKVGADPSTIIQFNMTGVVVTSVKPVGASVGATPYLMEEITFNYTGIEVLYPEMDPKTGVHIRDIIASWDRKTNTGS